MNKKSKPDVVINSVKLLKASEFGATAIKVELEAHLQRDSGSDWRSDSDNHDYLMGQLSDLGLAELRGGDWNNLSHGSETEWWPKGPLKYAEFYNDRSVDSEFTFTIALDDPNNIFLLPKIMAVWNRYMDVVEEDTGEQPEFYGSGMHMALINTSDCSYPSRFPTAHLRRFDNFQRSMTLLLPALFFLGSCDEISRPMEYREPRITVYDGGREWSERRTFKFSAITYNQGALEFRVFSTCYSSPEIILDNFVVMANAVRKYWRSNYHPSGVEKITRRTSFGNDSDHTLERLYVSVEHVDLLNEGLKRLKPSYHTIGQLKQQRSFRISKRTVANALNKIKREAIVQYKEYEARFNWEQKISHYSYIREHLQAVAYDGSLIEVNEAEVMERAEAEAQRRVRRNERTKQTLDSFIAEQIEQFRGSRRANWRLEVS